MKSFQQFFVVFVVVSTFSRTSGQKATYTIVAPTIVRPNTDYLVAVSAFNIGSQERKSRRRSCTQAQKHCYAHSQKNEMKLEKYFEFGCTWSFYIFSR